MEVRLAHEQGLLTGRNLSYFQRWALLYWLYMDRRIKLKDKRSELIQQTFNLFPERWDVLYRDEVLKELGVPVPGEVDEGEILGEDDIDVLNQFMEQMEQRRWIHADALGLPPDWQPDKVGTRV